MFIYVARHAWAGHFGDPGWTHDSLRELEPAGAERYMQVVQTLADRGFTPGIVATSPYVRCRQTAEIIAEYVPHRPDVIELDALTPGSDFDALLDWSAGCGDDSVCWVGHAPDVGMLTAALIGDSDANIRFAKGGVAAIRFDDEFDAGAGELYWHVTAKTLGI